MNFYDDLVMQTQMNYSKYYLSMLPAVRPTRTIPSECDRKMTIMMTPFMSCSTKLPIYGLLKQERRPLSEYGGCGHGWRSSIIKTENIGKGAFHR